MNNIKQYETVLCCLVLLNILKYFVKTVVLLLALLEENGLNKVLKIVGSKIKFHLESY